MNIHNYFNQYWLYYISIHFFYATFIFQITNSKEIPLNLNNSTFELNKTETYPIILEGLSLDNTISFLFKSHIRLITNRSWN